MRTFDLSLRNDDRLLGTGTGLGAGVTSVPLRIHTELPFSSGGGRSYASTGLFGRPAQVRPQGYIKPVDDCEGTASKSWWQVDGNVCVALIALALATIMITLLSITFARVGSLTSSVDAETLTEQLNALMTSAVSAARHTETATANAATMSILAREAATRAHPHVLEAINQTSDMLNDLHDFSLHPQLTISGSSGRRRRRD